MKPMPLLYREEIINYLAEIAMGELSLTFDKIEQEQDSATKELLFGLLCLHEDLVLQRKEVATLNTFLQNVLQSFSELLFIVNSNGTIQMVNKQSIESIQLPQSEIQHKTLGTFIQPEPKNTLGDIFSIDDFPYARIVELIQNNQFTEVPMTLLSSEENFPILVTGHIMESMHNVDASLLFSAKDGRQSRLLQELREKQQQLVQASKLASMGELSSGIAHELNNPLFVISGLTEVMQMQLQRKHPEAYDSVAKSFETMLIATEKMRDIINHIRIFARQEQMQFIAYSINEIIISGLLLIEQQLKQHDIQVKLNLIENSPVVLCAPNRLEQVIINLFSNARDAIESRRHQEPNHTGVITVSTESNLDQAIIRFRDNGTGIDEESAKKLYDPFYSTKEVGKGTGLGLSISYGIIQEHNATIEMSSALGEFTEFVLTFNPISD